MLCLLQKCEIKVEGSVNFDTHKKFRCCTISGGLIPIMSEKVDMKKQVSSPINPRNSVPPVSLPRFEVW